MKGTVHKCIEKLVTEKFGIEKWQECLKAADFDEDHVFMLNDDVDEQQTMKLITSAPAVLGISLQQVIDAFSDYWVNVYGPKVYPSFYEGISSAREFMEKLDNLHIHVTQTIPNAKPPRFTYSWTSGNTLEMTYSSSRGLVDLFMSMARAVGIYYNNDVQITKKENNIVQFIFN